VTARDGEASATGRVNGGLNDDRSSAKRPRRSSREHPTSRTFAVTDGRLSIGKIELVDGFFTTIDIDGVIVGIFDTLRAASRAFPEREGTA
jgi:hypothetical protein